MKDKVRPVRVAVVQVIGQTVREAAIKPQAQLVDESSGSGKDAPRELGSRRWIWAQ